MSEEEEEEEERDLPMLGEEKRSSLDPITLVKSTLSTFIHPSIHPSTLSTIQAYYLAAISICFMMISVTSSSTKMNLSISGRVYLPEPNKERKKETEEQRRKRQREKSRSRQSNACSLFKLASHSSI